ncbi:ROK family protein [Agromyces soli]|uniref:ROK family protein n=1 Tax=Agromyces soli TaxID=659012 RepID=A0ABY4AYY8_9MICO|nr:ROK family protein [Agromyces soli]UOE27048.1 ROK family protein [Agromyces soli]
MVNQSGYQDPLGVLRSVPEGRRAKIAELINLIAAKGAMSRAEAMGELGWSRTLVTRVATVLLDEGLLAEDVPAGSGRRGRPTAQLRLVVGRAATIGIDFGYRSVRTILASVDHTILASDERELGDDYGPDSGLARARQMIDGMLKDVGVDWSDIVGAGIAISGPIDYENNAPSLDSLLPHWGGDVVARAREHLPCPIVLGNDTRLACYAELLWGAGRDFDNFLYVKLHSGVGGAFVLNRRIVSGASGVAGEVGHMVVVPGGERCRCGGRGCLETVVGVPAIMRGLSIAYGHEPDWREVLQRLRSGDAATQEAFGDAHEVIGRATASLCNILNPAAVILGGALSRASNDIEGQVAEGIRSHALPACAETPVRLGALGRSAAALGAVGAVLMKGIV